LQFIPARLISRLASIRFVDAVALLDLETSRCGIFAFVNPAEMANLRKTLKDDLKYVEAFVRSGYVGTVAGVNIYTKEGRETGTIVLGTKERLRCLIRRVSSRART